MVEPSPRFPSLRLAIFGLAFSMAGCSLVPKSRLEDCRRLSQTLEADKARLKDTVLSQRSRYSELAQRADDDARRLRVQEEENKRLRLSVQAYQDERDQLANDFARVKSLLRVSSNPVSASLRQRFGDFAKQQPGCEFDSISGTLSLPMETLFEPGSDHLKPQARPLLRSLAGLLDDPNAKDLRVRVAGRSEDSPVRQVSHQEGETPSAGHLSLDRATRIRDQLALEADLDPAQIEVAGFTTSRSLEDGPDDQADGRQRRIEIQLLGPSVVGDATTPP